ncbi:MAG: PD-(D/E)XK nuclease family protein [Bacteroidales bacterium]|nr:PD-(D/E)XK nuclease family protein [Bacteroidales bacterium]
MNKLEIFSTVVKDFVHIFEQVKKEKQNNAIKGKDVNVFTLWNRFSGLPEPIHSKILHFFLSNDPMHGQGNLFLHLFMKRIGININKNEEWIATAEKGRVDVLLKRYNPHSVIIIENKSNWAGDQPNQLYRYWFENIHHSEEDCFPEYYNTHPEYKIVYLVPNKEKILNDNSMERPLDYPENLPPQLPIKPLNLSFEKDLSDWLQDCMDSLPKENTPLINLIYQYKEYCKIL